MIGTGALPARKAWSSRGTGADSQDHARAARGTTIMTEREAGAIEIIIDPLSGSGGGQRGFSRPAVGISPSVIPQMLDFFIGTT